MFVNIDVRHTSTGSSLLYIWDPWWCTMAGVHQKCVKYGFLIDNMVYDYYELVIT